MNKILAALGLDPKATEDDAAAAITALKATPAKAALTAREKAINARMAAGLNRETAEEAQANQEAADKSR